jgi:hypothetical protein
MDFDTATGHTGTTFNDQDGADYICDDGGFAILCSGHYTVAELEFKLAQLREANTYYEPLAR